MRHAAVLAAVCALAACRSPGLVTAPVTTVTGAPVTASAAGRARSSDAEITAAIVRRLSGDSAMAGTVVRVTTTSGVVDLSGTATNLLAKERAVRHAEIVSGVRSVIDRVVVKPTAVDDRELERDVRDALGRDPATDSDRFAVHAEHGVVTLRGTVESLVEKHLASTVAEGVRGVAQLQNLVDVAAGAPRADKDVAADVSGRLKWDVLVDDGGMTVDVTGGTVRLAGTVGSAAEKARAVTDAWVAGVRDVDASALRVDPWMHVGDRRREEEISPPVGDVVRAIHDAWVMDPRIQASRIGVTYDKGIATLRGTVDSLAAKNAAEEEARDTVGVRAVANLIDVAPLAPPTDAEVLRRVNAALAVDPYTEGKGVVAHVSDGKVTLTGSVASVFGKAEAETAVANVRGVRAVDDRVGVRNPSIEYTTDRWMMPYGRSVAVVVPPTPTPSKPDSTIATDLAVGLAASPFIDPAKVMTRVTNGRVVLTGSVGSWRASMAATSAAYAAGATSVDNRLVVP